MWNLIRAEWTYYKIHLTALYLFVLLHALCTMRLAHCSLHIAHHCKLVTCNSQHALELYYEHYRFRWKPSKKWQHRYSG